MFEEINNWNEEGTKFFDETEKRDAFIIQHHGYIGLGEQYGVSRPEILPLTWEQFSDWWDKVSNKERDSLLNTLRRFL